MFAVTGITKCIAVFFLPVRYFCDVLERCYLTAMYLLLPALVNNFIINDRRLLNIFEVLQSTGFLKGYPV